MFDECHKAKNLLPRNSSKPSKTGKCVLELQERLPKAKIVYCSATGASEPRHMAYMTRLGLWGQGTQFTSFNDFLSAVEKRGVGGMEVVAMDMKLRGVYLARQLSFQGSTFRIMEVPLEAKFKQMYDDSVKLVSLSAMHSSYLDPLVIPSALACVPSSTYCLTEAEVCIDFSVFVIIMAAPLITTSLWLSVMKSQHDET